jgi:hypothetical protein
VGTFTRLKGDRNIQIEKVCKVWEEGTCISPVQREYKDVKKLSKLKKGAHRKMKFM